jgi:hypothetical protein
MLKKVLILLLFIPAISGYAQELTEKDSSVTPISTQMSKSPSEALWRSIIPGWGQYYNEDYWKAPILFGAAVGLGSLIYYYNSQFNDYSEQLEQATQTGAKIKIDDPSDLGDTYFPIKKQVLSDTEIRQLKGNKELSRDNRDMMAFYLLGVYVISAVDAYVGAHLYDFNVDDKLSYNLQVSKLGYPEIALNYSF